MSNCLSKSSKDSMLKKEIWRGYLPCYFSMFCKDFIIYKVGNGWLFMRDKSALFPSISRRVKDGNLSGIISPIKIKGFLVDSRH